MNLIIRDQRHHVVTFFQKVSQDRVFSMAAALAYSTALSLAPLLILILAFLSSFSFGLQQELMVNVNNIMGKYAAQAFALVLEDINSRTDSDNESMCRQTQRSKLMPSTKLLVF